MSSRIMYGVVSLSLVLASAAFAQQPPQGGPPGGRPDFAQMQKDFLDRMKDSLGATDEDWKALEPRIQQVQQLQREASARGMMFGPPRGGPGGAPNSPDGQSPAAQPPQSVVQVAAAALQESLGKSDASPDEIKARLTALRDARTKAKAALAQAQDDLRGLLTARQEAFLVTLGILE